MPRKKQSTAAPPNAPRKNSPSLLRACMRTRVRATAHAPSPMRKRTKAICGPGRRAAATFVARAIAPNTSAADISATGAGGLFNRCYFFLGLAGLGGLGALVAAALAAGFPGARLLLWRRA